MTILWKSLSRTNKLTLYQAGWPLSNQLKCSTGVKSLPFLSLEWESRLFKTRLLVRKSRFRYQLQVPLILVGSKRFIFWLFFYITIHSRQRIPPILITTLQKRCDYEHLTKKETEAQECSIAWPRSNSKYMQSMDLNWTVLHINATHCCVLTFIK